MIRWSHSKLSTLLSCPMSYYLAYEQEIEKKEEKTALTIGSAVHWGIEHDTDDLSEYFNEQGSFFQKDNYTRDQILSESMVYGYLNQKEDIFNKILTDEDGSKLTLLEETHELFLTSTIPSHKYKDAHEFVGIIDLLLLTDKGFIILDYKTSSQEPDFTKYLEQIYRYMYLVHQNFPGVPVIKIGIINLKKTNIRQKKTENTDEFLKRMKAEYRPKDDTYIKYYEFSADTFKSELLDEYISNLSNMLDTATTIIDNNLYFINFSNAFGIYGKSEFYDVFYKTPDYYLLYKIKDFVWDEENNEFVESRDCVEFDFESIEHHNILNKYHIYKACKDGEDSFGNYIQNDELNKLYELTYQKEKSLKK